jgi:hypothetical protein
MPNLQSTKEGGWSWGNGRASSSGVFDTTNTVIGDSAEALGMDELFPLPDGRVVAFSRAHASGGASGVGAACEYAGTGPVSGGVTEAYCVIGDTAGAGAHWQFATAPSGTPWVSCAAEHKLTIVTAPDRIFAHGFE